MRLVSLKEYRRSRYSPESAPSLRTLRKKIDKIPGGLVEDGRYYVDMDENDRVTRHSRKLDDARTALLASPELEGLI